MRVVTVPRYKSPPASGSEWRGDSHLVDNDENNEVLDSAGPTLPLAEDMATPAAVVIT